MGAEDKMDRGSSLPKLPGCIFQYNGNIPETAYIATSFNSPTEEAVYSNDNHLLTELINSGHEITVHMKIGEMSCFEFASLKGYRDILHTLLENSIAKSVIRKYFQLEDIVDRANMISRNKEAFFGQMAVMMEVNRYVASLYNAVVFNQPECVRIMLSILGKRDLLEERMSLENCTSQLNAIDMARNMGHQECADLLQSRIDGDPTTQL